MSEQAGQATPTTTSEPGNGVVLSINDRADAIFGNDTSDTAGNEQAAAEATPAPDQVAQERARRRAALDALRERERQQVEASTAKKEAEELRRKLAEVEEKSKAYSAYVDPSKLTKQQFFELAEKNPELTPQELGEWLRERMANPEAAAARAAKTAVDPELAELRKQVAEQKAMLDEFMSAQQTHSERAAEQRAFAEFQDFTRSNASAAPLTANFLASSPDDFFTLVQSAAQAVPPHAGAQAVLDEVEDRLERLHRALSGNTQRPVAKTPPQASAAAKAPTHVSNTLAQQRSSVVDEHADLAALSIEERAARIFGG